MQHKYLLISALLCVPFFLNSQSLGSSIIARGGISIGGPIAFSDIPSEATGQPGLGPNLSLLWREQFYSNFSISIGIGYSEKGATFTSPVSGKYDAARGILGEEFPIPLRIGYTGIVDGVIENRYLDFPIIASYHLKQWRFGLGYQYSKLLKGSLTGLVDVKALLLTFKDQTFDESSLIKNRENVGIVSIGRQVSNRLSLSIDATMSFDKLMNKVEDGLINPRNTYVHLLVGFTLFDIQRDSRYLRP